MNVKWLASSSLLALLALVAACSGPAAPPPSTEVVAVQRPQLPADPGDGVWRDAPVFTAALVPQDMVEPRLLAPSTDRVQVRALTDGKTIAFRLNWTDPTADDVPGLAHFSDACAVQLPVDIQADVPAPQMGEMQRPVEIVYWRAYWQSMVDGREDSIKALFPNATVDHYPFEAASLQAGSEAQRAMANRYAPARALGNDMAGPRKQPVQDLIAEGPGTIHPAPETRSIGSGKRAGQGWSVVLSRPLPKGLEAGKRTQVAFAVWQGLNQESGARKMRSVWIPLLRQK
jgi:DMSO reductase family type II enzyme heme b subunit